MAAVVQPRNRFLPGIATLAEVDVRDVEPGLRREDSVVDLAAPARHARLDPAPLELVRVERRRELRIEHLARTGPVGGEALVTLEDEHRLVLLGLDLAAGTEAQTQELVAHPVAEPRVGQDEEVLLAAAPDDERRDHARLRRQQQRRARLADRERLDVVRDHPLQIVRGV